MSAFFFRRGWTALFSFAFSLVLAGASLAQGTETSLGGLSVAAGLPVEVTADRLQVDQTTGVATFSGEVLVVQGEMRLGAAEVRVEYTDDGGTGATRIARLRASGGVTLTSPDEAAEGQEAVYSVDDGQVVMTGDVALTQGVTVITGDRLVVNLADGSALIEGRVRTRIETGGGDPEGAE